MGQDIETPADGGAVAKAAQRGGRGVSISTVGLILTFVASAAAAVSAGASYISLEQSRRDRLLSRIVDGCLEQKRAAAEQIGLSTRILASLNRATIAEVDGPSPEWVFGGYDSYFNDYQPYVEACPEDGPNVAACRASLELERRQRQRVNELVMWAASEDARLKFEATRSFGMIGPTELADAEIRLAGALSALSVMAEDAERLAADGQATIAAATAAMDDFNAACQTAVR